MQINILGASGQLGLKVVNALLAQGHPAKWILASVRRPEQAEALSRLGVALRQADYDRPETLVNAFTGAEALLLIPTTAPVAARIIQHRNALEAAHQAQVGRVVFSSLSTAAFPDSRFEVTPFLLDAERRLHEGKTPFTVLRNNLYLDPIADRIPELIKTSRLALPIAHGRVAYISRDDLARATAAVLLGTGHAGKTYELTGQRAVSMAELAHAVSLATGTPVRFEQITDDAFAEYCRSGDSPLPEGEISLHTSLFHAIDHHEFSSATDDIKLLTGNPAESLEAYLRRRAG